MTKISLITACFNSDKTVRDTINSVNIQTYPDIEHIVVDGASRDRTVEIAKELATRNPVIVSEPDKGIYDAYNKGLGLATGEIIGFINSDDFYIDRDVIAEVMAVFEDPSVQGCYSDLVYVSPGDTNKVERVWKSKLLTAADFRRGLIPAHPTVFLRREVYEKYGDFDLSFKLAADYEFLLRLFYAAGIKARYVPRVWVRMRSGGATGQNLKSIARQNGEIRLAQQKHAMTCSRLVFFVTKVIDRSLQKLRAPFFSPGRAKEEAVQGSR
ncbi:MAG: glycosyltransferase family 2 protein [Rhizobium sp.]|nr:glycosyltransferase family 2 protein [Rhizobium sp.]MDM8013356.1 glycosyltransferase family 2 protein [Rhizobium sp.]